MPAPSHRDTLPADEVQLRRRGGEPRRPFYCFNVAPVGSSLSGRGHEHKR